LRENRGRAAEKLAECNFVSAEFWRKTRIHRRLIGPYATRSPGGGRGTYKTRPTIIVYPATYPRANVVYEDVEGNRGPFITRMTEDAGRRHNGTTIDPGSGNLKSIAMSGGNIARELMNVQLFAHVDIRFRDTRARSSVTRVALARHSIQATMIITLYAS